MSDDEDGSRTDADTLYDQLNALVYESLGLKEHFKGVVPANYQLAIDAIVTKMQAGNAKPKAAE